MPQSHLHPLSLSLLLVAGLRMPIAVASELDGGIDSVAPPGTLAPGHDQPVMTAATRIAPPNLALAEVYEPGIQLAEYLVSEKFDGVRALWDGRRLITRGGLIINAPPWFTAGFPSQPLDGELWMGRGRFARVSGTVRTLEPNPKDWQKVRYVLFDLPAAEGNFAQRFAMLERLVEQAPSTRLQLAAQQPIEDHQALKAKLERVVAAGGEGLMLHRHTALYRAGRSSDLLKVKPYLEGEAVVLEHLPGRGKYLGMLGSMLVEEPNGTRFKLGSGLSDAERAAPPAIGSIVSFKYHGRTKFGRPRFASFLRIADDL
jgi:DNA ligase-1